MVGLVVGEKATSKYKSSQADPTFCAGADRLLYPSGPSTSENCDRHPTRTASGKFSSTQADCPRTLGGPSTLCSVGTPPVYPKLTGCTDDPRTVRYPLADHPLYIFATETSFCSASGDKSHERRTVHLLPADRPRFQNSDCPEFCQLSQIQL